MIDDRHPTAVLGDDPREGIDRAADRVRHDDPHRSGRPGLGSDRLRGCHEGKHGKGKPNPASSVLKIKGSEIQQTISELLVEVAGPFAVPYLPEEGIGNEEAGWESHTAPHYFNYRKVSIYGGSNEIQRNIIAKASLGL